MTLNKLIAVWFFTLTTVPLLAEKGAIKFGEISKEMLMQKSNNMDSSAGAVIIFDRGITSFDFKFEVMLERHVRIKIYNNTEFDKADIKIPFAENDRIEKFKAAAYNLVDGNIVESSIKRSDTYNESVREGVDQMRFSIPNVKEGTIIEYTYRVNYGGWRSLNAWYFQTDIPTLSSVYTVKIPEYFTYKQVMSGYVSLNDVSHDQETGRLPGGDPYINYVTTYKAANVPAFKDEPYIDSNENYISKIRYELSLINIPGEVYEKKMADNYMSLSRSIAKYSDYYGKSLVKNKFMKTILIPVVEGLDNDLDKVKAIYKYVRDTFKVDYDVEAETIRRLHELKKGYPSDINRVLAVMLREAGYKADIVRLSTRSNGALNKIYAMQSGFNYTVILVTLDNEEYLLDASVKKLPFNVLPEKCLNGKGLVVSETNPKWVELKSTGSFGKMVFANLEIQSTGVISGTIDMSRTGYAGIDFIEENEEQFNEYAENFEKNKSSWTVEEHDVKIKEGSETDITEKIEVSIEGAIQDIGAIMYLDPLVFGKVSENPFKADERQFPINFGTPVTDVLTYKIKIPEGYSVEEIPERMAIGLPNNAGRFIYNVQALGEYISINSQLKITNTIFPAEQYPYLKAFYAQVSSKHAEQIVLRKQ